jgi:hypothetical protein
MNNLDKFSFDFVMKLYRTKMYAEQHSLAYKIEYLKQHYPDLFTPTFERFIENLKETVIYLQAKGHNFMAMLNAENEIALA